jgi:hypothetical protein
VDRDLDDSSWFPANSERRSSSQSAAPTSRTPRFFNRGASFP